MLSAIQVVLIGWPLCSADKLATFLDDKRVSIINGNKVECPKFSEQSKKMIFIWNWAQPYVESILHQS